MHDITIGNKINHKKKNNNSKTAIIELHDWGSLGWIDVGLGPRAVLMLRVPPVNQMWV